MKITDWLKENGYEAVPSYNESSIQIFRDGKLFRKLSGDKISKVRTTEETLIFLKKVLPARK